MAKRSKHLGLGKAVKAKKQKVEEKEEDAPSNELTVELNEEVDADDDVAQVKALWKTYWKSEKDNELVLNGIVHECDRILRNDKNDTVKGAVDGVFHAVYALSLADLANFHTADEDSVKQIDEYFNASLERIELGLEAFPESADLLFAQSRILINRIPLQYVSQLTVESKSEDLGVKLDEAVAIYERAEKKAISASEGSYFVEENLNFLETLDDLLDMVDNFGKSNEEGDDEEDEDSEEDEDNEIELEKSHPLYSIQSDDKYNQWWRDHTTVFLDQVDANADPALYRELNKRLGQSYLQEADIPSSVYTALAYDDEYEGITELQGSTQKESQEISQGLFKKACEYFVNAEDKEDPETWVPIAEAKISLGNLYDLDSEEQEELYKDAEKILKRANKATQGKYQEILDNLLEN